MAQLFSYKNYPEAQQAFLERLKANCVALKKH